VTTIAIKLIQPRTTNYKKIGLHTVAGILILVLAFLYVVKTCADCPCVGGKKYVRRTKPGDNKKDPENPAASTSGAGDTR